MSKIGVKNNWTIEAADELRAMWGNWTFVKELVQLELFER